jgi:ABC-type glycerol-3-phosphate transport system substrate-binding protein
MKKKIRYIVIVMCVICLTLTMMGVADAAKKPLKGQTVAVLVWPIGILDPVHAAVNEFEEATGAKVILDPMGEDQLRQKLITEFASKKIVHNVVLVDCWGLAEQQKYFRRLDDLIAKNGGGFEGLHDFNVNDFDKNMIEILKYGGEQIGIPFYWEVGGLHYRTDLFEKYKVKIPTNYEEYMEAAKALTLDVNNDGKIDIYGTAHRAVRGEDSGLMAMGAAWMFGTSVFEGKANTPELIKKNKAKPIVNTQPWIDCFTFFGELLSKYGPPGVTSYTWTQVMRDFKEAKLAMDIDANYFVGLYNAADSKVSGKAGLALTPVGPDGVSHYQHPFVAGIGIPKGAPDVEAAWEFIKWYTAKSTVDMSIVPGNRMTPCIPALIDSEKYKKQFGPVGDKILETLSVADWRVMPVFPENGQVIFHIGDAWSSVIAGSKTPKQALDDAQKGIMDVMTKAGYYE